MSKKTQAQILTEFIEGLNEMAGAAGVMIHHHQDLRWHFIRQIIEETRNATVKLAVDPLTARKHVPFKKKTQVMVQ